MSRLSYLRRIDDLGRVVIPKEVRKGMNIHEGDSLSIYVEGTSIFLRKEGICCTVCGSQCEDGDEFRLLDINVHFEDKFLCGSCEGKLRKLFVGD